MRMVYVASLVILSLSLLGGFAPVGAEDKGQALYKQYCSVCHGAEGKGNGPGAAAMNPKPRDHSDGAYMNKLSDAHLTKVVSKGGAAVGRSPLMPGWESTMSAEQIQQVIAFVRTLAVPAYKP